MDFGKKLVLAGGAGLVGQNLITHLLNYGYKNITVIDKHRSNLNILKKIFPEVTAVFGDLSESGSWEQCFEDAHCVVMLQAQIGGTGYDVFERNNIVSTKLVLEKILKNKIPRLIYVSSSVVESGVDDFYTRSKIEQEQLVLDSGINCPILRPTLMFGWFDRKHLGWLSRFMMKSPLFPVPGHGRYMRQPLYVGDFCKVIISCIQHQDISGVFNISGHEKIDYIDIIREIRRATGSRTPIVRIPYWFFHGLLGAWSLFDSNPPFTTQQLAALVARDEFEITDWPTRFGVRLTPFAEAIHETFNDPTYSNITLQF